MDGGITDGPATADIDTAPAGTAIAPEPPDDRIDADRPPVDPVERDVGAPGARPAVPRRRGRRLRRFLVWSAVALLVVAAALVSVGAWAVRRAFPQYSGALEVPGLTAAVTVDRDRYAIPQIYASNLDDLFTAQGYTAAQERFYQMDFDRHFTSGTLSAMFGPDELAYDKYIRTMDWRGVAEQEWSLLSPSTRRALTDFSNGVNAYLGQHAAGAISLEYTVLHIENSDYRIAPWSPIDSIAWLKALSWDLAGNRAQETERADMMAGGLSRAQVDSLFPAYPYGENAPIVTGGGSVRDGVYVPATAPTSTAADAPAVPEAVVPALDAVRSSLDAMSSIIKASPPGTGSNSWVISGRLTTTGAPILENDPHLSQSMPSIWYQMGLHCGCGFDVEGQTFPDMPGVIVGHNSEIAWGLTNLGADVTDLYIERIRGNDYEVDGKWLPMTSRTTTIPVAGGRPVTLTIRGTNNGPLLSDVSRQMTTIAGNPGGNASGTTGASGAEDGVTYGVAIKWAALTPGRTMDAVLAIDRAADWNQFRAGASLFASPSVNMIYADVHGNIGYQAPGLIPVRGKGNGEWPAPGWDSAYDWTGYIPFAQLPYVENPPSGYIVAANQAVADPTTYHPLLTDDWTYGYRSQRIGDMIRAATANGGKISLDDVRRMELDTRNGFAAQIVADLLSVPGVDADTARARSLLAGWDFTEPAGGPGSGAAAFFNQTWHDLLKLTFDEVPTPDKPQGGDRWFVLTRQLLARPDDPWWDDKSTPRVETATDILREALRDATGELTRDQGADPAKWAWGRINTVTIRNLSLGKSGIPPVEWLFNYGPVGVGGGCDVVLADCSDITAGYGQVSSLPSMRMIVDLADFDDSRWLILTGESGHAFSPHYHDQLNLWSAGALAPMPWTGKAVDAHTTDRLTLRP